MPFWSEIRRRSIAIAWASRSLTSTSAPCSGTALQLRSAPRELPVRGQRRYRRARLRVLPVFDRSFVTRWLLCRRRFTPMTTPAFAVLWSTSAMVKNGATYDFGTARALMRAFHGPMLKDEVRAIDLGAGLGMAEVTKKKRELLKLSLPGGVPVPAPHPIRLDVGLGEDRVTGNCTGWSSTV